MHLNGGKTFISQYNSPMLPIFFVGVLWSESSFGLLSLKLCWSRFYTSLSLGMKSFMILHTITRLVVSRFWPKYLYSLLFLHLGLSMAHTHIHPIVRPRPCMNAMNSLFFSPPSSSRHNCVSCLSNPRERGREGGIYPNDYRSVTN
jgi:hypothetical protein